MGAGAADWSKDADNLTHRASGIEKKKIRCIRNCEGLEGTSLVQYQDSRWGLVRGRD